MNKFLFYLIPLLFLLGCKTAQVADSHPEDLYVDSVSVEIDSVNFHPIQDYHASKSRSFDLLHTKLELAFDWDRQHVIGKAHLKLRPYFYEQEFLILDAKGFDISRVALIEELDTTDLKYEYPNDQIFIELGRPYSRNEELDIFIDYKAKPNERSEKHGIAITSDKGLYFINPMESDKYIPRQIWTQGETTSNSAWFPTIDAPNERCTQEMYLTVEDELKTLSNGVLVSSIKGDNGLRTDYWKLDKPHAPYLFMLAVGKFVQVAEDETTIPVSYYVDPEYEAYAKSIFGNTPEMITFFSEILDYPYPWPKYDQIIVRDFVSGAMENTTSSVFMDALQMTDKELLDENWDYIIAHELFHQWFGDLVTCESWANLTLNEAFASFGEQLWIGHKYGKDELNYHVLTERDAYLEEAGEVMNSTIRYYYEEEDELFDNHTYARGGLILRMLKGYVGDEAFFYALNKYLKDNAFQSVEIHDLRIAFEDVTGEDLNWFFNQWFMEPGHPVLEVDHIYEGDTLFINIIQSQDLSQLPLYKLPMILDIYAGGELLRYPLIMEDYSEELVIPLKTEPDLVVLDGEFQILGEIIHPKTLSEFLFQLQNCDNLIGRYDAFVAIAQSGDLVATNAAIKMAFNDSSFRIRSLALEFLASAPDFLSNEDLLAEVRSQLNDSISEIRSSALYAMALYNADMFLEELKAGTQDEAYSVQGVALEGLLEVDKIELTEYFEPFMDETQVDVLLPTAGFVNVIHDNMGLSWYLDKMSRVREQNLFYLMQYFVEFILESPVEDQKSVIPLLKKLALENSYYLVRLAAFQSIALLDESLNTNELLREIIEKEQDPRLIEFYNQIQFEEG